MQIKILLLIFISISACLDATTINKDSILNRFDSIPNSKKKVDELIKVLNEIEEVSFSYKLAELAYLISLDLNDPICKANSLNNLATYSKILGNYQQALNFYNQELAIREDIGDKANYAEAIRLIGELNRAYENFDKAIQYTKQAEILFTELNDNYGIARTHNRFAAIYFEMNSTKFFDSIIKYAEKSLNYSLKNELFELAISNYNILASLFRNQKKYDIAIEKYYQGIELSKKYNADFFKMNLLNNLALTYFEINNFEKAIEISLHAYQVSESAQVIAYQMEAARILKDSYVKINDFYSAYKYSNIYSSLYQINFNQEKTSLLADAEAKYQSVKKEKDIEKQKQTQTNLIIIFTSILIITFFAIAFFYI